jgi:hypothetical protein
MTEQDQAAAQAFSRLCVQDPEIWWRRFGVIKTKNGELQRAPKPNAMQSKLFAYYRLRKAQGLPCLILCLKPRQKGASTWAQAVVYHHLRANPELKASIMGDVQKTSDTVFGLFERYATEDTFPWPDGLGSVAKGDKANLNDEITLTNGSLYIKETAGSRNAGRGGTIQVSNMTEVAHFQVGSGSDPTLGYLPSFAKTYSTSLGIADSTPNGPRGWFYEQCISKSTAWKFIFSAWFEFDDSIMPFTCDEERDEFMAKLRPDEIDELSRFGANGALTPEMLNWRRYTIDTECAGDVDKFRQEYPSDARECFLKSARPRFNISTLEAASRIAEAIFPTRGTMGLNQEARTASFVPDPTGATRIFEEPKFGCSYLVSVDCMTGEDQVQGGETADPDYHSIQVWRSEYFDQHQVHHASRLVALYHTRVDIDLAAVEAFCMSLHYGDCLIVPEINNCGLALVKKLQELGANIYKRSSVNVAENRIEQHYGWRTDAFTRKTIIDHLAAQWRDGKLEVWSTDVLEEMKSFVVNKNGKPEAMPGMHDDHVLSMAIGVFNLPQATKRDVPKRRGYSESQLRRNPMLTATDGFVDAQYVRR